MARPFQAASALPSRAGCGRVARRSRSRLRSRLSRARTSASVRPSRSASCVVGDDPRQDRDPLPVALVGHPVGRLEQAGVVAEGVADLGGPPGEGQALDPVGVGVLAGGERPVVGRQLADHVVERPDRDRAIALVAGERPGVQVDPRELRVVVQHLLEMRHEPAGVGRVAVEAAAELVAQAAVGHRVERPPGDGQRPRIAGRHVAAEQELDGHRLRELRRPAPAAVRGVERGLDGGGRAVEQLGRRVVVPGREPRLRRPGPGRAGRRPPRPRRAPRARRARRLRGPGGTRASRAAARRESRSRRRTGGRRASGTPTSASRRPRSSTGRRPCRPDRDRAVPRGRP